MTDQKIPGFLKLFVIPFLICSCTQDPAQPAWVVLGDAGSGDATQYRVARAISTWCFTHRCDFVLYLGDNFYDSGVSSETDPQWTTKFEQPYRDINLPFYAVMGNHDYADTDLSKSSYEIAYGRTHLKWVMPSWFYSFTKGVVDFIAIDSQRTMIGTGSMLADQQSFVTSAIQKATSGWKIAYGHHPYISNGTHGDAGNPADDFDTTAFKSFYETYICGKVDVYISGHDHNLQVLRNSTCGELAVVSGSGGKETSSLPGSHPTFFQKAEFGFMYMSVNDRRLTVTAVNANGASEFTGTYTR